MELGDELCLLIVCSFDCRLLPCVLLVPPGHAAANLLKADILATDDHYTNFSLVTIALSAIGRRGPIKRQGGQAGLGLLTEVLTLFWGIYAGQTNLVLLVFPIEKR